MKTIVFAAVIVVVVLSVDCQKSRSTSNQEDAFAFPDDDIIQKPISKPPNTDLRQNEPNDDRKPLFVPGKCAENQLLYPGDKKDDWVCDCAPGFLWNKADDKCYAAFSRGPCKTKELFVYVNSAGNEDLSGGKCIKNLCKNDDEVRYKNQCWQLHKPGGPCQKVAHGGGILGVNPETLALDCLKNEDPGLALITAPKKKCYPGTKLFGNRCRQVYYRSDKNNAEDSNEKSAGSKE